jgi:hypothetical protein
MSESGAEVGCGREGPPINRPAARALRLPSGDRLSLTVARLRASPRRFGFTDESSRALALMHPSSRHSPQLASHGAPSDKTANATASRRTNTVELKDRPAITAVTL